ncbi:MAG: T9SS type A sorting domain-containing protein, partial [Phaeodactylibacter sp.]|nr:T9SS type A sorting domain-containing protein [Phaeodactylibacter sp.]
EHVNSNAVNLRLTTDGGDSWTDLPALQMGRISSLAMVPGSRYILATMRTSNIAPPFKTILSTDLGQSWQEIGDGSELACNAQFASPTVGYAGEWQPANHPTRMYKYAGSPLSGLLSGKQLDAELTVFPNPASDFASVHVKTAQPFDFLLLLNDAQGRLVERQVFPKTDTFSTTLDLQALPSGLYTLTVSTREGAVVRKVLKQ